jgi:hypothetical protein
MKFAVLSAAAFLTLATTSNAAVLVTNGGFETGDLTGWSSGGDVGVFAANPHLGAYSVLLVDGAFINQTITTTPGHKYQLDYWLEHGGGTFAAKWGGTEIPGSLDTTTNAFAPNSFEVIANSSSTVLTFEFLGAGVYLDDVVLTDLGPVPEPASLSLLALGALALLRRKTAPRA